MLPPAHHATQVKVLCSGLVDTMGRMAYGKDHNSSYPFTAHPKRDPVTGVRRRREGKGTRREGGGEEGGVYALAWGWPGVGPAAGSGLGRLGACSSMALLLLAAGPKASSRQARLRGWLVVGWAVGR